MQGGTKLLHVSARDLARVRSSMGSWAIKSGKTRKYGLMSDAHKASSSSRLQSLGHVRERILIRLFFETHGGDSWIDLLSPTFEFEFVFERIHKLNVFEVATSKRMRKRDL